MSPMGARTGREGAFVIVIASRTHAEKHNAPALVEGQRVELHAY